MAEHHVLGISGGKDSAALAIYMREHHPELDIKYFFTDTGKELPEVHEFLGRLEGFLGKPILRLNPNRGFDFWLREYGNFLPSPNTRWCTRQLKLLPFRDWIKPWLDQGDMVHSYVAIRGDEDYREGYTSNHENLKVHLPFRSNNIDKAGVTDILEASGLGLPRYYEWRSRSGCTFCFYQQKIEWIGLMERHPEAFDEAKMLEKTALASGSPFTWIQGEPLTSIERPERVNQIKLDFEKRKQKEMERRVINPLRPIDATSLNIDDLYLEDEGGGACLVCHK